jgi:hypothetical protein
MKWTSPLGPGRFARRGRLQYRAARNRDEGYDPERRLDVWIPNQGVACDRGGRGDSRHRLPPSAAAPTKDEMVRARGEPVTGGQRTMLSKARSHSWCSRARRRALAPELRCRPANRSKVLTSGADKEDKSLPFKTLLSPLGRPPRRPFFYPRGARLPWPYAPLRSLSAQAAIVWSPNGAGGRPWFSAVRGLPRNKTRGDKVTACKS